MNRIRQMVLTRRKARGEDTEAGFTLIELLVVLLIIAILLAIAVPTFLSARTNAQNSAAMASARNAYVDVQTYYTDGAGTYKGISDSTLAKADPAIGWASGSGTTTANHVVVAAPVPNGQTTPKGQSVEIDAYSASGECYVLADVASSNSGAIVPPPSSGSATGITSGGEWYAKAAAGGHPCEAGLAADSPLWSQSTATGW